MANAASKLPTSDWTVDGDLDDLPFEQPQTLVATPPPDRSQTPQTTARNQPQDQSPPPAEKIAEAMLFVGGSPLNAEKFATALRVSPSVLHEAVISLNKKYRTQNRPYSIQTREGGYLLVVKPMYKAMREKLFGGPREARLSQQALDVLSIVAYRQPTDKAEIESIRGVDSGSILRQLQRLGLIALSHRAESAEQNTKYATTVRFLEVFGLNTLDDLPRFGESEQL